MRRQFRLPEADELYLDALIEIGLVLFVITLIVNSLSRLLIWSMARTAKTAPAPAAASTERDTSAGRRSVAVAAGHASPGRSAPGHCRRPGRSSR